MNTITVDKLAEQLKSGASLRLLDVRSPTEYLRLHAAGACLIPVEELNQESVTSAGLDSNEPVYVLCQGGTRAATACEKLSKLGLNNAIRVDGGTIAWEKASLPVVTSGQKVMSIERQVRIVAGSFVLIGLAMAWFIHPAFAGLSTFVGAGLIFAGITDFCGLGMLMAKLPWNRPGQKV